MGVLKNDDIWYPGPDDIRDANATALAAMLRLSDYEALYRFSIEMPAAYWRAVNRFCDIVWRRDYTAYADVSAGIEFPEWFVGGELNWTDSIFAWADNPDSAGQPAVIAEREDGSVNRVTYSELRDQTRWFAAGLLAKGIKRGDRVGLLLESGVEAAVSLLAISYIGAIAVPLFSGFGPHAVVSRLAPCSARALVATSGFLRRGKFVDVSHTVLTAMEQLPVLEFVVMTGTSSDRLITHGDARIVPWAEIKRPASTAPPSALMSANDPFMVIYTSGTTGQPKGAVHTHGGFPLKIAHDSAIHYNIKKNDVFCWPADMGWIAGSLVLASALMRGATLVCYDGAPDFPDWSRMSRLIEKYRVTHYGAAPTLIRGLAANGVKATAGDLSSIRLLITAGEVIAPEHFLWFQRHFGRGECPLINYTGGTEVSGALLGNVPVKPITPGTFNSPSPGVAAGVVDLNGNLVLNEIGELAILAPFVGMTKAFWQDEQRYLDTYWRAVPRKWLHGDLAMKDGSGYFTLHGRSDDTIKVAGKRFGPSEVEQIAVEVEGVNEAAVIGAEDPLKGQALVVFLTSTCHSDAAELSRTVSDRIVQKLGKAFSPKAVHLVTQLPKTRSSKIMRRVIRSAYDGTPPGDLSSLVNPEAFQEIAGIVKAG